MTRRVLPAACVMVLLLSSHTASQTAAVEVVGDVPKPVTLSGQDLEALPRRTLTLSVRDTDARYEGVLLVDVLRRAGLEVTEPVAGETLTTYVVASGADGYRAVLALPEAVPSFSGRTILLASTVDGKPLPSNAAPWQLVVQGDQRPTRWVRQLVRLEVRRAN